MEKEIVRIDTTIAADTAQVWRALTGKDAVMMPGTRVKTDWRVGHPIVFSGQWQGKAFEDHGEIRTITSGREVSFTHWSGTGERPANYHVVSYVLSSQGDETKVTLTQTNVGPKADVDEKTKAEFTRTFRMMLDELKKTGEAAGT